MMSSFKEVILAVSSSLPALMVAKATLVMALGLVASRLARRSRAAVRHSLLAATFGVLLALPIASVMAPPVQIGVSIAAPPRVASVAHSGGGDFRHVTTTATGIVGTPATPDTTEVSTSTLLFAGWIIGAMFFLLPMANGLRQVGLLRRSGMPWRHGQSVADALAIEIGIQRPVEILVHETLPGPMMCGVIRPAIVLPADAQTWGPEELNRALVHELEHVRRGDWISHCLARAVCALYWFHPLTWIMQRQLALEAERSCDDAVLGRSDATAYADQLVELAQRLSAVRKSPALAMVSRSDLSVRVGAVLDGRQRRGRAGMLAVSMAGVVAAVLVITVSPLTVVAAPQTPTSGAPTTELPAFTSNTNLVIEDVIVSNQSGKRLDGLKAADFAISEDGKPQIIALFEFQSLLYDPAMNYYILAYYSTNGKTDGAYRHIAITLKGDTPAKLDYRAGYYGDTNRAMDPAARLGGLPVALDPGVRLPSVLTRVDPAYSEEARKAKYSGTVTLTVEVGVDGRATDIKVARPLGMGLDEKAVDAIQRWRFTPAKKDGDPVAVRVQVLMSFRLS